MNDLSKNVTEINKNNSFSTTIFYDVFSSHLSVPMIVKVDAG